MQFLKFCRPFRADYEFLATVPWVVWDELRLASIVEKGQLKPQSLGRGCLLKKTLFASDYFLSPVFPPLYYFHLDFKVSSRDLFLYCPEPLKNSYWNHSSPSESFPRHRMNYRAGQISEGRGSFPSREEWILRVSLGVFANGCFVVRLPCVCGCSAYIAQLHVYQHFGGLKVIVIYYSKLSCKICKRVFHFVAVLRGGSKIKYIPW